MNENPSTPAQPTVQSENKNGNGQRLAKLNSPFFIWPAAITFAVLLFFALNYFVAVMTHESTDDAFITGHIVSVAPRIPGQVSAVHVLDNQLVHSNDLLVEIEPSDYATTLAQKQASAQAEESNYKAALAGYELMGVKVTTAEAQARSSTADADAAAVTAKLAKMDLQRNQKLLKQQTISAQEFDNFKAAAQQADANLNAARQKAAADESKVNEAKAQMDAAKAEAGSMLAQFNQSKTEVNAAQLNLSYAKIFAPGDGRVTGKQVEIGDYLQIGQTILSIVPTEVWVVANFKESQLKKMKPGQPALVEIDALGGRKFRAHVDSIQAGSGAAFSLLPPENATGNFVKVVQRVPVKIVFDQPLPADHIIGPGLSVEPDVRVSKFTLPDFVTAIVAIILAIAAAFGFQKFLNREKEA